MAPRSIRSITDPQDLRALAHPLRLGLLGALRLHGPATASELARRLEVSSGLTSYHLRALAERGFVEDDPGRGNRRERWWRASHDAHAWTVPAAGGVSEGHDLAVEVARVYARRLEQWAEDHAGLDARWREAATSFDRWLSLSPDRLRALAEEVDALLDRYEAEDDGPDAERVGFIFAAHPER